MEQAERVTGAKLAMRRGRQDGSIRRDVGALDIIVFGALLAQQLPHVPNWKLMARRQADIYFDGLAGSVATSALQRTGTRDPYNRTTPILPSQ